MLSKTNADRYFIFFILSGFLVTAIILSLSKNLWLDETHTTLLASFGFDKLITFIKGDTHPPFYFIVIWLWSGIFGDSILAFRIFSILAHIASSLAFMAILQLTVKQQSIRIICFTLFVFSPALLWYAVEVRMYSLLVFFVTISLYFLLRTLKPDQNKIFSSVALATALSLSFYTHYTAVFFIIGLFSFFGIKVLQNNKEHLKPFIISTLATFILTAPWFSTLLEQREVKYEYEKTHLNAAQTRDSLGYIDEAEDNDNHYLPVLKEMLTDLASISGMYPAKKSYLLILFATPFLLLVILFLLRIRETDDLLKLGIITIIIYLVGMLVIDLSARRYMLLLAPLLFLLIAKILSTTFSNTPRLAMLISAGLLLSVFANAYNIITRHYYKPVYNLVTDIKNANHPDELIVVSSIHGQIPIEYAAKQLDIKLNITGFPLSIHQWWKTQIHRGWGNPVLYKTDVKQFYDDLLAQKDIKEFSLVLFDNKLYDQQNYFLNYLKLNSKGASLIRKYKDQLGLHDSWFLYHVKLR